MTHIRIGVIGLGWMGREHARNVLANPKAQLAAVADSNPDNAARFFADRKSSAREFRDYRELLKSDVDAVVIAAPNALHAEMALAAARHGKHIYCEKPMAITRDDCRRMRDAVTKAGVKFLIGYHRRLNPLYQHARGLLADGKLGAPFLVESDYIHFIPGNLDIWTWLGKEAVAGSIFHAGSGHNVDLIRYFCGEIKSVACMKGIFLPRQNQVETEDTAVAIFRFASGALGKVQCAVGPIAPFTFNFKLYGTKGSVINNRVWLDSMPEFGGPGQPGAGIELPAEWIPDNVQGGVSEPWNKLMDHFIAMLAEGAPCLNDVESACRTSEACFAAVESARRGEVIDIGG